MKVVVTDFTEVEKREEYDPEVEINPENFKSLVFEYQLPDWVYCQVKSKKEKKNLCGHEHKHGYLGKTKDGPEGLIGGDCGEQYFGAHPGWRSEVARLDRAKALAERVDALETLLIEGEKHEGRIVSLTERLNRLKFDLAYLMDKLPKSVRAKLHHMAKGSSTAVLLRFCRVEYEKDENGKERPVYSYYQEQIGKVAGAKIEDQTAVLYKVLGTVTLAKRALREAVADPAKGMEQLGLWIDQIVALDDAEDATNNIERVLRVYTHHENLKLQIFMVHDPSSQQAMAKLAMEFAGALWKVTDPNELIRQYRDQIMAANKGRTFTVAF